MPNTPFRFASLACLALLCLGCGAAGQSQIADAPKVPTPAYPSAARGNHSDNYHGKSVLDPYRWLEEADAPDTRAWVEAENTLFGKWIAGVPDRAAIRRRLEQVWNHPRWTPPVREAGRSFYRHNDGLQNQAVLLVQDRPDAAPRTLLDPNTLSTDGTVALSEWSVSRDGKRLAYALAGAGSDWVEIHVRDVETGKDLADVLKWVKFSGLAWNAAGTGLYYSRYDAPADKGVLVGVNEFQKLCYHALGTPQAQDPIIAQNREEKSWGFGGIVSEDGLYLVIPVWKGADNKNALFIKDLKKDGPVTPLVSTFESEFSFVGSDGPVLWLRTDDNAPRGRIIAMDLRKPERSAWREIIAQGADTLDGATVVGDRFVTHSMKDAHSDVRLYRLDGKPDRSLELPGIGSAEGFTGHAHDREMYYQFSSFLIPNAIYRYDFASGQSSAFARPELPSKLDAFETKQVFVPGRDGTRIPLFITARKGIQLDGSHPLYLYGYGGFNVSMTPWFSAANLVWLEMGGIYAMPVLRGGGEYGEAWHKAGMRQNKQHVFNDFIDSAEWLVREGYTRKDKLAIGGGSNGGLLVGACLTQRPDLFGAALPAVGVMDMLRFHKFTIGWAWVSEYGSADNPGDFESLYAYSPLHNIRPGTAYPATLVTTGDHDDRVVPGHSFKFAATLQAAQAGRAPILIRIETRAGHGAGKPTAKLIDEAADRWAFLVANLHVRLPQDFTALGDGHPGPAAVAH